MKSGASSLTPWAKRASATCKQEFHQDRSNGKIMLKVFFDIKDFVYLEFIPEGCTNNKELCLGIMRCLHESICKERPRLCAVAQQCTQTQVTPHLWFFCQNKNCCPTPTILTWPRPCNFHLFPECRRSGKCVAGYFFFLIHRFVTILNFYMPKNK